MQTSPKGRQRVYCASRAEGLGCDFSGTFLDVCESQIEWYLANFIIPEDYQKKILEAHHANWENLIVKLRVVKRD